MAISLSTNIRAEMQEAGVPQAFKITENYKEASNSSDLTKNRLMGFMMKGGKVAILEVSVRIHVRNATPITATRTYRLPNYSTIDKELQNCTRTVNDIYKTWNKKISAAKTPEGKKFESGEGYNEAMRILKADHFVNVR